MSQDVKRRFVRIFRDLHVALPSGWRAHGWELPASVPSTPYMAVVHWLEHALNKVDADETGRLAKLFDAFHDAARTLVPFDPDDEAFGKHSEWTTSLRCISEAPGTRHWKALNGEFFFESALDNELMFGDRNDKELHQQIRRDAEKTKQALRALRKGLGENLEPPTPFYSVLTMDGDSLGKHMRDGDKQEVITAALEAFTKEVGQIVREHSGFLIYAGGDDVLALLPLEDALGAAVTLRQHYRTCFDEAKQSGKLPKDKEFAATLSGAVEFAHIHMPLTKGKWQRLYPLPADLVGEYAKGAARPTRLHRLDLGPPRHCDLGPAVRLPRAPRLETGQAIKALEGWWISAPTLTAYLAGATPSPDELIDPKTLFQREARLGIARSNRSRTASAGMLYQTNHLRPRHSLAIEMDVSGPAADEQPDSGIVRLGGEGRPARFEVVERAAGIPRGVCAELPPARGLTLLLMTPTPMPGAQQRSDPADPLPLPGFQRNDDDACWRGDLGGIALRIHGVAAGRCLRQGGWDLVTHSPRPVRSLVAPGTLFFATLDGNGGDGAGLVKAIKDLNGHQIADQPPEDLAMGRGLLAAGIWPDSLQADR